MQRYLHEVVELTQDCDLGARGDRAVVVALDRRLMTLVFPARDSDRKVTTGADYRFMRGC